MKLNDLIKRFEIAVTNEKQELLDKIQKPEYIKNFQELVS